VSNALVRGVTFFGSVVAGVAITASAVVAFRRRPRIAQQVVAGALGGISAELVIKRFFRRERPTLLAHLEEVQSSSFPSGHSMAAASLYLTLAFVGSRSRRKRGHRAAVIAAASALASGIGATRVFLGVHWPTDVLGGLALGTAWACATEAAFDLTAAAELADLDAT
jgi:undecaprenyl-diphosphatase